MAEGKNSFVLYKDNKELWEEITDEQAGKLIKHIFKYVNDENPSPPDEMTKLLFIPIKANLKRDLKKYEKTKEERSNAAVLGNLKRWNPDLYKQFKEGKITLQVALTVAENRKTSQSDKEVANIAVSVSDSVSVSDINSINTIYSKKEFLEDWNQLRTEHLKKPSFLNSLTHEDLSNLNDLSKDYSREQFREALTGLFKQKKMPNGNKVMQSNPKHFLTHFNAYLAAFHDRDTSLYGKEKAEAL